MNPVALYFASGDSLYAGSILTAAAILISLRSRVNTLRVVSRFMTWPGLALMIMASPPFSWTVDVVFAISFLLWLIGSRTTSPGHVAQILRIGGAAILLLLLIGLPASELLHRRMPAIQGIPTDHLVVIGDSISSGIDPRIPAWPLLLQERTGVQVVNLSRAGAGVAEAQAMVAQVQERDSLVLIEIGGNDLLSGESSERFREGLEALLSKLSRPGRTIVMFELPLLPHRVSFGRIQRQLAAHYKVFLIPKHYFAAVICGTRATSDGLHLSDLGARRMAALVTEALGSVLDPAAIGPHAGVRSPAP